MKKIILILTGLVFLPLHLAQAVCPVCTVAVGAGIGLSRYFGIDDVITGLWIGGLILSVSFWTEEWLEKKNRSFPYKRLVLLVGYYAIVILPLFWKSIIGHPDNKLWGIDKIILGTIIGSVGFYLGTKINLWMKKRNDNHVYFPFQKVVMAIIPLVILSLVFYIY